MQTIPDRFSDLAVVPPDRRFVAFDYPGLKIGISWLISWMDQLPQFAGTGAEGLERLLSRRPITPINRSPGERHICPARIMNGTTRTGCPDRGALPKRMVRKVPQSELSGLAVLLNLPTWP